jgi:16S rRNA (adenine1518-N6/adenine1519-N6)-dimethyltransferase
MKFLHKKSLGQNFLNNAHVPKVMADAGEVQMGDLVLEVGPGTGVLTRELLNREARVIAIEADARAVEVLRGKFAKEIEEGELMLKNEDVKKLNITDLELSTEEFKVVSNIPYFLSGFLFRFFLDSEIQPSALVFLVQKEVAERIARDKKESLLSLSIKVFGDPTYIQTVKRGNFTPQPKVDSAVVAISNIEKTRLGNVPSEFFFEILHEGFKAKRKQLLGNLSQKFNRDQLVHIFSTLDIPPNVRAEDVPLNIWLKISRKLLREY